MLARATRILALVLSATAGWSVADPTPCRTNELRYAYTECDSSGGRWRVALPLAGTCQLPAPVKGKPCSFSCAPGMYLDMDGDQECHPCPAGTFSLGGSARFERWDGVPAGFETTSGENVLRTVGVSYNCSRSRWEPRGDRLLAVTGPCVTTLSYSVKLVADGIVSFEYQAADPSSLLQFKVKYDCGMGRSAGSHWMQRTEDNSWTTYTAQLSSGVGMVLSWTATSYADSGWDDTLRPIMLKSISISGTTFTSECVSCRNGTYSSNGAQFCTVCPKDTWSDSRATTCRQCAKDVEYAPEGSATCSLKPPCSKEHFFEYMTPCQGNQTMKMYRWLEPLLCNPLLNGSVPLPPSGKLQPCPPCNPGSTWNGSACSLCPAGAYSDGVRPCQRCPVHTAPVTGVQYRWWNSLPPNVTTSCLTTSGALCDKDVAWSLMGDHVATSSAFGDNYAVFWLNIAGFHGQESTEDGQVHEVARVTFVFQLDCDDGDVAAAAGSAGAAPRCSLMFLKQQDGEEVVQIEKWQGRKSKQPYVFSVTRTDAVTFMWVFSRTGGSSSPATTLGWSSPRDNVARIFSVDVTNTLGGGAVGCEECPLEVESLSSQGSLRCTRCPDGHYMERVASNESSTYAASAAGSPEPVLSGGGGASTCLPCPSGAVLKSSSSSFGAGSCRPCGSGLLPAKNGVTCRSDCTYSAPDGKQFDFSAIARPRKFTGSQLFAGDGSKYYHEYMIALCPQDDDKDLVECVNNITTRSRARTVKSMACRATVLPSTGDGAPTLSTQPISIADEIVNVTSEDAAARKQLVTDAGYTIQDSDVLIHLKYVSAWPTPACPGGRSTIVTLLCDPSQTAQGSVELPPKCPDGTCDGCSFTLLWRTKHGCPRCSESAYSLIVGECVGGEQEVHYIPPKHCVIMDGSEKTSRLQRCNSLSLALRISIVAAAGFAMVLVGCVVYCWCRNRKLTYKYMALVETAAGGSRGGRGGGEMPAADSCALREDEEEEDAAVGERRGLVVFSRSRLLSKLKGASFSQESDGFEKMHLVGGSGFTQSQI